MKTNAALQSTVIIVQGEQGSAIIILNDDAADTFLC
jgi:hypothetical protein